MIIAVVQIPMPQRSAAEAIRSATATAPTYRDLGPEGLLRKDYLNGEAGGGGIYAWTSRQAAEAWFNDAWRRQMRDRFGTDPVVTYYESLVTVDNVAGTVEIREPADA
jgi:hypothetical protein